MCVCGGGGGGSYIVCDPDKTLSKDLFNELLNNNKNTSDLSQTKAEAMDYCDCS